MTVQIATTARDAMCNAFVDLIDAGAAAGHLFIYTGAPPATPQTADSGAPIADLTFSDPAFDDAGAAGGNAAGVSVANAITQDANVDAGTAGHFRIKDSNGNVVAQGTVTATGGGGDLEFDPTNVFVATGTASITSMSATVPESC